MPRYSSVEIESHTMAFNLENIDSRPNIRNVKYKTPNDHLCCPICQQPFIKPLTTKCGHTFCKECIHEFLKVQTERISASRRDDDDSEHGQEPTRLIGSCPLDRTPLDASMAEDLFPTPLLISNLVDDLEVYCLNIERGCVWTGRRWEVEQHVMSECGYTAVACNGRRVAEAEAETEETELEAKDEAKHETEIEGEMEMLPNENENRNENEYQNRNRNENRYRNENEYRFDNADIDFEEDDGEQIEFTIRKGITEHDIERETVQCKLLVERRFVEEMEEAGGDNTSPRSCLHEYFACDLCHDDITCLSKEKHLQTECEHNYSSCNLCLNDVIPVKNLAKHKDNCSKMGHITCPAAEIGCDWVGSSETSLEIHLQQNNCQLSKLLPYMQGLNNKIDKLTEENTFLHKQINKILNLVIQGKITNLGYHEPMEEINKFSTELSSIENQDKLVYLNFEMNRLKFELDEKILPYINRESTTQKERENILNGLVSDNFLMKDDLNLQRTLMNSLRKQLQFMLFTRGGVPPGSGAFFRTAGAGPAGSGVFGGSDSENAEFDASSRSSSDERLNLKL